MESLLKPLFATSLLLGLQVSEAFCLPLPDEIPGMMARLCFDCHQGEEAEGGLNFDSLKFTLDTPSQRARWTLIHDRIQAGEMPPGTNDEDASQLRASELQTLGEALFRKIELADRRDIIEQGRGRLRRLTREEYEANLRDVLKLPHLDIQDILPEDREQSGSTRVARVLDLSRVQLTAYLNAAEIALDQAMSHGPEPPPTRKYRAEGTRLFQASSTFGGREAMFFAKDDGAVVGEELQSLEHDPTLELALFRSAHWPYFGYPKGFVAQTPGEYRVRFSARSVRQIAGFHLLPANKPVPMTFRARKPSGPDVSGDVRATGGLLDIQPEPAVYETRIRLQPRETFEYSLLGLPVPLARNVEGGPPTYRFPPFPEAGQPGVAFQWLEVEGPLPPASWPSPSHEVLFDHLGVAPQPGSPKAEARRLLKRFMDRAAREPLPPATLERYFQLVERQLEGNASFTEAMLTGYKAFLCSSHFLLLRDTSAPDNGSLGPFAVASRLSHFLTNTRPDTKLMEIATANQLRDSKTLRSETDRLIDSDRFGRFVESITNDWLDMRKLSHDEPNILLYPEYRFDFYLVESMARETRQFVSAMIRENLPVTALIETDFVFANDRLAAHYDLPATPGSHLRKVQLPEESPYGGLLTQAAIMKVTANGTSTSPVIRGAWVMDRLLGSPPPPPPKSVPAIEPDIRGAQTIREQLAKHAVGSCAKCHSEFDPIGFGLENFDIYGRWRTRYRGRETGEEVTGIDRAGHDYYYTLGANIESAGKLSDGQTFENIHELKMVLSNQSRQLARNVLHRLVVHATGVPIRFSERAEIETLLDSCEANGYRLRDLLHALVQSRIFLGQEHCR